MMAAPAVAVSANVDARALFGVVEVVESLLLTELPAIKETPDDGDGVE